VAKPKPRTASIHEREHHLSAKTKTDLQRLDNFFKSNSGGH
jgi:hypothetical protein